MSTAASAATEPSPVILHARHEHGGHPVHVFGDTFEVHWPDGPARYDSARQLVRALYNRGDTSPEARDPGMTFDRYFRTDRLEDDEVGPTVFDLFAPRAPARRRVALPTSRTRGSRPSAKRCPASAGRWYKRPIAAAFTTLALFGAAELLEAPTPAVTIRPFAWADTPGQLSVESARITGTTQALVVAPTPLGIDLAARGHEVRKLVYKMFGARVARKGYDIEEVLQEVYQGLLARNKGICPFDPAKSSFGHYVVMVGGCILNNYERKMRRRRQFEQIGMFVGGSDHDGMVDAAVGAKNRGGFGADTDGSAVEESAGTGRAVSSLLSVIQTTGRDPKKGNRLRPEAELAAQCLPLVYAGHQRAEIAAILGEDASKVGRALAFLRRSAATWKEEAGIA